MGATNSIINQPLIKRIPTSVEYMHGITNYGLSNLYPQIVEEITYRSPAAKRATEAFSNFLKGQGWFENGDVVINRYGHTIDDLTRLIANDKSKFNGWAVHVNTNIIGGITEYTHIPFKYVRYGIPDENGRHIDVKVNINWENDPNKTSARGQEEIREYPLYQYYERAAELNLDTSNGYVFYVTEETDQYPLATGDSVLDSAQVEAEIQVFELGSIQNSFLGTSIFKYPAKINSDKERNAIKDDIRLLKGAENAGGIMLLETPPDFDGSIIENLPANNNDRLFELTGDNVVDRIVMNYGVPLPIMGIQPDGGIFNQEQVEDSFVYYNSFTRDARNTMASQLEFLFGYWYLGALDMGNGIIENQFSTQVQEIKQETLMTLIKEIKAGILPYETAIIWLTDLYGIEEERAINLLGEKPTIKENEDGNTTN